jgi:hypothetical protein
MQEGAGQNRLLREVVGQQVDRLEWTSLCAAALPAMPDGSLA